MYGYDLHSGRVLWCCVRLEWLLGLAAHWLLWLLMLAGYGRLLYALAACYAADALALPSAGSAAPACFASRLAVPMRAGSLLARLGCLSLVPCSLPSPWDLFDHAGRGYAQLMPVWLVV